MKNGNGHNGRREREKPPMSKDDEDKMIRLIEMKQKLAIKRDVHLNAASKLDSEINAIDAGIMAMERGE